MISPSRLFAVSVAAACLGACLLAGAAQAASPAWVLLASSGPTNLPPQQSEVQRVAVDAEGGTFTLKFGASETAALAYDVVPSGGAGATASVQNALEALPGVGAGNVAVSGGPGGKEAASPYIVSFKGVLANTDQPELIANGSSLSGAMGHHTVTVTTAVGGGPGTTELSFYAQNVGGLPSAGATTISFTLPAGVTTEKTPPAGLGWSCLPAGSGQSSVTCTTNQVAEQGFALNVLNAPVVAGPGAASGVVHVTVSGGGAVGTAVYEMPLVVSAIPAPPGLQSYTAGAYSENGVVDHRAGAHPYSASAGLLINTKRSARGEIIPSGEFRNILVDLPPGFLGNPTASPQCPESVKVCDVESIVATAQASVKKYGSDAQPSEVYNVGAPFGFPARFRFGSGQDVNNGEGEFERPITVNVVGSLRSDKDYGVEVGSRNTPQIQPIFGSFFTFWGTPASSSHDGQRCVFNFTGLKFNCGLGGESTALLTNPTNCAEEAEFQPVTTINVNTWQAPDLLFSGVVPLPPVDECDKLKLEANFAFVPSGAQSDSPTSFQTNLTVPSAGLTDPERLAPPEIKETVVTLPEGVVLNAAGADGLQSCSLGQIGFKGSKFPMPNPMRFDKEPDNCPEASKIGTAKIKTPLLEEALRGNVYLAAQGDGNPFGSLFAIYLVVEDPRHGIVVKLPGRVDPDPQTGQMAVTFSNLPQVPFSSLELSIKGGSRSALANPPICGQHVSTMSNTPWSAPESGPPTQSTNGFAINQGPNGLPCAATLAGRPFDIGWRAGSESTKAGADAPFALQITRPDGSQELQSLEISTPAGMSATLKGIPYCSEGQIAAAAGRSGQEELANPACPTASQVGTLQTGAGSGPTPFYVPGKLYLAGPYKGAPISLVAVTPAVAGPFDLGNVVVRSAVFVNGITAQVSVKSDPIPQILKGVVLRVRDVRIKVDRKGWAVNPTSCEASSVKLTAYGNSGAVANKSTRFQVGDCDKLGFKPNLKIQLHGGTKRAQYQRLEATLTARPGDANIARAAVALPHSEFLAQEHINTVCTRVQFAADQCPAGSVYGRAEATSPLLDDKLSGPVYLRSSNNPLPDLVAALRGPDSQPIEIELSGRTDSIHGGIRNTFDVVPDVPVTKFRLNLFGGRKSLILNSRDLCKGKKQRATVKFTGQNGKQRDFRPVVENDCGKKGKGSKKGKKGMGRTVSWDLAFRIARLW